MPTLSTTGAQTPYKGTFYYQFASRRGVNSSLEVTSLAAVCSDDTCSDCEIDHRSSTTECDPNAPAGVDALEYYSCHPVNPKVVHKGNQTTTTERGGSWFVHKPVSQKEDIDHEVCVLEQHSARSAKTNTNAPVTLITYPSKSNGPDASGQCTFQNQDKLITQATHAYTNTPLQYDDCSHNGDGLMYKLDVNGTDNPYYSGLVNCRNKMCTAGTCDYFEALAGTCPPVSDTVAVVRADGQLFGIDGAHVPVCAGSTPKSTFPSTATATSTTTHSHKKPDGDGTVLVAAITVGVLFFGLICYGMFVFLRRRKMKRMNAYAALQDDPTF